MMQALPRRPLSGWFAGLSLLALCLALPVVPALAQQGQGQGQWFVPGQGQGQRPAQAPAQPAQTRPVPAPPPTPSLVPPPGATVPAPTPPPQISLQQLPPITPSAPPPPPIIGVLDVDSLRQRWAPYNNLDTAIRNRVNRLRGDEARERQSLDEATRLFVQQRAQLNPEQQRARQAAIEGRARDLTTQFGERQREIQTLAQQGEYLETIFRAVVSQVARARGINLILRSNVVALNDAPLDITNDVLAQLQLVPVAVNIPPEPPAPAAPPSPPVAAPASPAAPPATPPRRN